MPITERSEYRLLYGEKYSLSCELVDRVHVQDQSVLESFKHVKSFFKEGSHHNPCAHAYLVCKTHIVKRCNTGVCYY